MLEINTVQINKSFILWPLGLFIHQLFIPMSMLLRKKNNSVFIIWLLSSPGVSEEAAIIFPHSNSKEVLWLIKIPSVAETADQVESTGRQI